MFRLAIGAMLLTGIAVCLAAQTTGAAQPATGDAPPDNSSDGAPAWVIPTTDLNQNLPAWLRFDGAYRNRVERDGGIGFKPKNDNHDLSQLRAMLIIQPTHWLQFVGETQDSRIFGNQNVPSTPPYQNTWDLRQAYVQLGSASNAWFDMVGGREVLSLGEERLIGPSNWLNMGRTFDLVRLNLHHSWFRLSLFASAVIVARDGVIRQHNEGTDLHGAYASLSRVIPRATLEPYVFWRVAPANVRLNENAGRGALNEVTLGARVVGELPGALKYDVEMDRQAGSLGPDSIDSWAGHWNVARPLDVRLKPRPFVEANYASGTKDPTSKTWSTFDQLYPSSHDKLGFADQVGWRNIEQVRAGISESVSRKWKFTQSYENFWLARARDALYASSGALVAQSATGSDGRHVGQEVDAWAEWNWREVIELGFGYARFLTGSFLNRATPGKDFNYPFLYLTYEFTLSKSPVK